jgi:hypothetical protein
MVLDSKVEDNLINEIKQRFGESYFFNHTMAAVSWMKQLIKKEGGNERILITAIYLHDVGYPEALNQKKNDFDSHKSAKALHMEIGARIAKDILGGMNFNSEEINEITHLISVHDKYELLSTFNEQLVFEADSLSVIDRERVKPDFSKEDYQKFLEFYEKNQILLFKTKTGKEALKKLWPIAKNYFLD